MKFIIGKKIEMTQIWKGDDLIAVTKVQAGPCGIVQIKNVEKDGYKAVQIGYGERKEKNIKKPQKGHLKGLKNFRYLKEFRITDEKVEKGNNIDVTTFAVGDIVKATGTSKGKGFQGVVKRWGFAGQIKTHGNKDQLRMPGSIGATGPAHVFKGTRMGGRMGGDRVTTTNLEIIEIDVENNILFVKGSVPGCRNGLVEIKGEGELKTIAKEVKEVKKETKEVKEVKEEKKEDKKEDSKK